MLSLCRKGLNNRPLALAKMRSDRARSGNTIRSERRKSRHPWHALPAQLRTSSLRCARYRANALRCSKTLPAFLIRTSSLRCARYRANALRCSKTLPAFLVRTSSLRCTRYRVNALGCSKTPGVFVHGAGRFPLLTVFPALCSMCIAAHSLRQSQCAKLFAARVLNGPPTQALFIQTRHFSKPAVAQ